jgi:hypothetical protein
MNNQTELPRHNQGWTQWCPEHNVFVEYKGNYPRDNKTEVLSHLQANNPNTGMLPSSNNGGLYGGEQVNYPWIGKKVSPTGTNYTYNQLRSANPPPGAELQFQGGNRLGNNHVAMPNVYWFNPEDERSGQFHMSGPK